MTGYDDYRDEDAEDDIEPLKLPEGFDTLKADWGKWPIRTLWGKYTDGTIDPEPDFQRHYVWNPERASRYIESLLLGFPTPPLFLAEEADGQWVVIDGHQRLETLFRYMQPLLRNAPLKVKVLEPLTLSHMEVMPDLNGTQITHLKIEERKRLWATELQVVLLPKEVDSNLKYSLFARLNQGSMSLNPQELRNCLYRGRYNDFISRRSESRDFLSLWGANRKPDKRMKDRERLLRFYALLHRRNNYTPPFRIFLNEEMQEHRELPDEVSVQFDEELKTAIRWTNRIFGKDAFCRFEMGTSADPAGRWVRSRKDLLFDVQTVSFAEHGQVLEEIWANTSLYDQDFLKYAIRLSAIEVMLDPSFQNILAKDTTRATSIHGRFERWNAAINRIIKDPTQAIGQTQELHDRLSTSNSCSMCPGQLKLEDARLDNNGKLAHRYCRRYRR